MWRLGWTIALVGLASASVAQDVVVEAPPPLPRKHGVDFGPYAHYYKSRASADLRRHSAKIIGRLRGLNRPCPTCKRAGLVKIVIREGFYDVDNIWIPPVEDVRECPTCERRKDVFNASAARSFVSSGLPPESRSKRGYELTRREWMTRLERSHRTYRSVPRTKYEIRGRYAILSARSGDGIFPLHFHLLPNGTKFAWYLHDPAVSGPFSMGSEFPKLPGTSRVEEVYAGDTIVIGRRRVVRLAGITIPGSTGKILKRGQSLPDGELRARVRAELLGKTVELVPDKYAQFTYRGNAIAFVKLDGKDYGLELIRRGLARRHPKHKTQFNKTYMEAEKEARNNKAGVWARLLKK